jgi:hypothetical protein
MLDTVTLTEVQWQAAHNTALALVRDEVDINELKKATSYLRSILDQKESGRRFFDYLQVLINNGKLIGHSGKTIDYYRNIKKHCDSYLRPFQSEPTILVHILGWTTRLATYYKSTPTGELPTAALQAPVSAPTPPVPTKPTVTYTIDQVIQGVVTKITGVEVAYDFGDFKRTQKEHKQIARLKEGQQVKAQITELREDGSPKKFKLVEILA